MRVLLQRVREARVHVDGEMVGQIGPGWLAFVGIGQGDDIATVRALAEKTAQLRCFADDDGKTNLSVQDVGGAVLVISQFTLYADVRLGRRPGFADAAPPDAARALVDAYAAALRDLGLRVAEGEFGAHMQVTLVNDGPFTIWLDSATITAPRRTRVRADAR